MSSTLKPELLERYAGQRRIFIETGTARGDGVEVAVAHGFETIYSIEANPEVWRKAQERFLNEPSVHILLGDGGQQLPPLLRDIHEPAVFWLDSHWSTGEPALAPGCSPCPILAELSAIAEHPIKDHIVMVDDVRYFWAGLPQWRNVTIGHVIQAMLPIWPDAWLRFERGVTPHDILIGQRAL